MRDGLDQQYRAVASGHWPLMRYDPMARLDGAQPVLLDSPRPRISLGDYRKRELRFRALAGADPAEAERLLAAAQQAADTLGRPTRRWPPAARGEFAPDARRHA